MYRRLDAKITAIAIIFGLIFSLVNIPVISQAATNDSLVAGTYTVKTTMLKDGKDKPSMSDALFAEIADVVVADENAEISIYVAFPIPNYPNAGKDGTLKNFYINYQGTKYTGVNNLTTKPLKPMKKSNLFFGVKEGKEITTQIIKVTLPKTALKETKLDAGTYVNVMMNTDVELDIKLSDLTLVKAAPVKKELTIDTANTNLKDEWGSARFRIAFEDDGTGSGSNTKPVIPTDQEAAFVETTQIEINGTAFGTMNDIGFIGKGWPGANTFHLGDAEALKSIKAVIKDDVLKVKLTTKDYGVVTFDITNELDKATRDEIAGTQKPVVDKSALEAKITEAEAKKEAEYTADSYKALQDKLAVAKDMVAKADATQAEVDAAKDALVTAIAGLQKAKSGTQYIIRDNKYMTNLDWEEYQDPKVPVLEFAFVENDANGDVIFKRADGEKLIETASIQLADGKVMTWKEAGVEFANDRTHSSFKTSNIDLIRPSVDKDPVKLKIILEDGTELVADIPNRMDDDAKAEFHKLYDKPLYQLDDYYTFLRDKWGTPSLRIGVQKLLGEQYKDLTNEQAPDFAETTKIEINGKEYGTIKDLGMFFSYGTFRLEEVENLKKIKDAIKADVLKVKLTTKEGQVLKADIKNELTDEQKQKILGEKSVADKADLKQKIGEAEGKKEADYTADSYKALQDKLAAAKAIEAKADATQAEVDAAKQALTEAIAGLKENPKQKGSFSEANVRLVKAKDHSEPSMAGAVLTEKAEVLIGADGKKKLVIHFKVAEVMGRTSYTTDFTLGNGNIPVAFEMRGDNSSVAVIDLPDDFDPTKTTVYDGWINSNQMDADVALEITKVNQVSDNKTKLDELIAQAESDLAAKEYYEKGKTNLENVIASAKNSTDYVDAYAKVVLAMAKLREKKANPFEGEKLSHVQVSDPGYVGGKLLQKWGRVTVNDKGESVLKVHYDVDDSTWQGKLAFKDVKVYDKDGKEIPAKYTVDKMGNGTLEFVMPYIPESGVFKVKETELDGRETESDLILDYSTIKHGPYRELIKDAIEKYNKYTKDDWFSKGDLEEKKADFTEKSWKKYADALKAAKEAYDTPGISQEKIDEVIENLKNAKFDLLYKVKAGKGNDANLGFSGINNPNNYYTDGIQEKPNKVGWAGSKLVFGKENKIYHILNDGNVKDKDGNVTKVDKIFILAEDLLVNKPFADTDDSTVRWENSAIRAYLNGDFFNETFLAKEKKLIPTSTIEYKDYEDGWLGMNPIGDAKTAQDKVFLPSIADVTNAYYGMASKDARDTTFDYATRDVVTDALGTIAVGAVKPKGRVGGKYLLNSKNLQGLPALYVDTKDVLLTLQNDYVLDGGLKAPKKTESNTWRLIVKDSEKKLTVKAGSDSSEIAYTTENATGDELIAMVVRGGDYKSGQLVSVGKVGVAKADGKLSIDVPNFDKAKDKLYLFAANKNAGTSFASEPVEIKYNPGCGALFKYDSAVNGGKAKINKDPKKCLLLTIKENPAKMAKVVFLNNGSYDEETFELYNIDLFQNKKSISTYKDTKYTITLPLTAKQQQAKKIYVYHLNKKDLSKKEEVTHTVQNGFVTFEADSFSPYAVVAQKEVKKNCVTTYSFNSAILHETADKASMSDPMFAEKVDVTLKGKVAEFKFYVAYPIPAFKDMGKDGTLKNFFITYDGKKYVGKSDISSKPMKPAKKDAPFFGLEKGKDIAMQVITVKLPKAALDESVLAAGAYVNVMMNTDVNFRIKLTDKTQVAEKCDVVEVPVDPKPEPKPEPKPVNPKPTDPVTKPSKPAPIKQNCVDGYRIKTAIIHENKNTLSMSDPMFAEYADARVQGDNVVVTMYVAYPIPAFKDTGKDGTLKNFYVLYKGKKYYATSNITSRPLRAMKTTAPFFGLVQGKAIPTQMITFTLPKAALKEKTLEAGTYVNVMMNTDVKFRIKLIDVQPTQYCGAANLATTGSESANIALFALVLILLASGLLIVRTVNSRE